jgi:hypothetical protein
MYGSRKKSRQNFTQKWRDKKTGKLIGGRAVRARLHVDTEHWFTKMAKMIEAMIAEFHAELVFTLGVEAATALVTSGKFRTFVNDVGGNFWMNF